MLRNIIMLGIFFLSINLSYAQLPWFNGHTITANNGKYNMVEVGMAINDLPQGDFNPYDPEDIDIQVTFRHAATGYQKTVVGFPYREYLPPAAGPAVACTTNTEFLTPAQVIYPWRARFAPPYVGQWTYEIVVNCSRISHIFSSPVTAFTVLGSNNKGYIGNNASPGFKGIETGTYYFTNGDAYFPTGTNLHLYNQPYCKIWFDSYRQKITELADVGANYARLLMAGDGWNGFIFNVEWGANANLGNYDAKQNIAFVFDNLLQHAEQNGIYYQLGLVTYGDMSDNWANNPFSKISGNPYDFYTNITGKKLFKQRLRYILARWGYSTNIFAWELFCEADVKPPPNTNDFVNWLDEMSGYIKSTDNNHLLTISTIQENYDYQWNTLHGMINLIPQVDFMSHHVYGTSESYNFAQVRREFGIAKTHQFQKPFFAGEFGNGHKDGFPTLQLLEHDGGSDINAHNQFHNTIWSSSFSGQSGTSSIWYPYVFDNSPNAVIRHITPLRILIDKMDLRNDYFESISSTCNTPTLHTLAMEPDDLIAFSHPSIYEGTFATCESWHYPFTQNVSNNNIYKEQISFTNPNEEIAGTMASRVLIFGLKSKENIYGWIHKKDNFWWKLPHLGWIENPNNPRNPIYIPPGTPAHLGPLGMPIKNFDYNCAYYYNGVGPMAPPTPNKPANALMCYNFPLEGVKAKFDNVCNGEYYIDYYSAYPNKSVDYIPGTSTLKAPVDGGKIVPLTRRLFTSDHSLYVNLPLLEPFSTTPSLYAPDYGYHIRREKPEKYEHLQISNNTPNKAEHGHMDAFYWLGAQIFTNGLNHDYLQVHWFDPPNNQWVGTYLTAFQFPSERSDGPIAADHFTELKVFYRGLDSKMHFYEFMGSSWSHFWANPMAGSNEDVYIDCTMQATSEQVFYRGAADGKLHMYYDNGTNWVHTLLNPSAGSTEDVANHISTPKDPRYSTNEVFFTQIAGGSTPYVQIGMYRKNGSNSNPWTYSVVSTHNPSDPDSDPAIRNINRSRNIASGYVNGQLYVFYIGTDNHVQYYTEVGGSWLHGRMSSNLLEKSSVASELSFRDNVLYYFNEHYNTIGRFYWDNYEWRYARIDVCGGDAIEKNYTQKFRLTQDANIVYIDDDNQIDMLRDVHNCTNCPDGSKPGRSDNGINNIHSAKNVYEDNEIPLNNNLSKDIIWSINQDKDVFTSEHDNYRLEIYPNPASDKINITMANKTGESVVVKMLNTLGAVVKNEIISPNKSQYELLVGELPRGLYTITLTEESGRLITTQKISLH